MRQIGSMKVLAVVLMVLVSVSVWAQDAKINSAQSHYNEHRYAAALVDIDEALSQGNLNSGQQQKAHLLRGQILLRGCGQNNATGNEMKAKNQNCFLQAFGDLKKAQLASGEEKLRTEAGKTLSTLHPFLVKTGLRCFHEYRKTKDIALLDKAIAHYKASLEIVETGYNIYDQIGQAYLEKGDTPKAAVNFKRALEEIKRNAHTNADFLAPYVFYKMALIYRSSEPLKALVYVHEGLVQVDEERQRLSEGKAVNVEQAGKGLDRTERDLKNFRLKNSSFGSKMTETPTEWKVATEKYPNSIEINYGYARVLDQANAFSEAVKQYKKVLELNPGFQEGHYKLGALCWNNAVDTKQAGKEVPNEQLELALLHFEKSFELKPEKNSVNVILQITKYLKLDDKYAEYSRKKKAYGF